MKSKNLGLPVVYATALVVIAQILLPVCNGGRDWLVFSPWNMFSFLPSSHVSDFTWDRGQTFFFRDHLQAAAAAGIDTVSLYYLLQNGDFERIRNQYRSSLNTLCGCSVIDVVKLKGSLWDHVVLKRELSLANRSEL